MHYKRRGDLWPRTEEEQALNLTKGRNSQNLQTNSSFHLLLPTFTLFFLFLVTSPPLPSFPSLLSSPEQCSRSTQPLTFTIGHLISRHHPLPVLAAQMEVSLARRELVARVADGAATRVRGALDPSVGGTGWGLGGAGWHGREGEGYKVEDGEEEGKGGMNGG